MSLISYLSWQFMLPFILWIILSLRIYPDDIVQTLFHSGKIFIGCGLYGFGLSIITNGILSKLAKKTLGKERFIKLALWLAVLTAFSASMEFYFGIGK